MELIEFNQRNIKFPKAQAMIKNVFRQYGGPFTYRVYSSSDMLEFTEDKHKVEVIGAASN